MGFGFSLDGLFRKEECPLLSPEAQEARRRYKREWARRNPDKVRAQQERYWMRKALENASDPVNHDSTAADEEARPE